MAIRFPQEDQIRRVGGRETIELDVRIVSATNARLGQAIAEGRFREDLFYRRNVLTLRVPPLRDRPEGILPLANHFLRIVERDFNRHVRGVSPTAMVALRRDLWPGNVRELKSMVRRAVIISGGPLIETTVLDDQPAAASIDARLAGAPTSTPVKPGSSEERITLLAMLDRTSENITALLTRSACHAWRCTACCGATALSLNVKACPARQNSRTA